MNKRTLTALKGSIKKWHNIVNHGAIDRGVLDCPLCNLFDCDGCPIMIETGRRGCGGSPYDDYSFESDKANAKKELDFLVTLLPEGEVCKVEGWGYYWVMK